MKTKCNHCGVTSNNQPDGDGCHACLIGIMRKAQHADNKSWDTEATGRFLIVGDCQKPDDGDWYYVGLL